MNRKIIVASAAAPLLAAQLALGGVASASTAAPAAAPRPHCLIGTWVGPCHCPRGWHVAEGAVTFHCARNRRR